MTEFDSEKFYLGRLCKRGHDFNHTGLSLRYNATGDCTDCAKGRREKNAVRHKAYVQQHYQDNKERYRDLQAVNYQNNKERYQTTRIAWKKRNSERVKATEAIRRERNREKNRQYYRRWSRENKDKKNFYVRRWRSSDKGRESSRRSLILRRLSKKGTLIKDNIFKSDLLKVFNYQCPYCGRPINLDSCTFDHVIPVSKNGKHSADNLLPCCQSCNSSKRNSDMIDWYSDQDFFTSERLIKICEYLATPDFLQFLEYFKIQLNKSSM